MLMMRVGLFAASAAFLFTTWTSWDSGFPFEVAFVRGGLAFMAVSFVAYLGELVIATAPPVEEERADEQRQAGTASAPARGPSHGPDPQRQNEAARDGTETSADASAAGGWNERQAA